MLAHLVTFYLGVAAGVFLMCLVNANGKDRGA